MDILSLTFNILELSFYLIKVNNKKMQFIFSTSYTFLNAVGEKWRGKNV